MNDDYLKKFEDYWNGLDGLMDGFRDGLWEKEKMNPNILHGVDGIDDFDDIYQGIWINN